MSTPGRWLELMAEADPEAVESVSEIFARYAYNGGIAIEEPFLQEADGENFTIDPDRPVIVRAYLPLNAQAPETIRQLEQALWHLGQMRFVGPLQVSEHAEEDWANAWKDHFHVHRIGRRFVIRPSWRPYEHLPGDVVIDLDPGMAFGTGLHPTTQLTLVALEEEVCPGMRVLDLGTGSGILTIGALKLGASHVVALDTDEVAISAARANIDRNHLRDAVMLGVGSLGTVEARALGRFDLIAANIIARVIIDLAPEFTRHLTADGILIASGIIIDRRDEVLTALHAAGLTVTGQHQSGDWLCLRARRSDAPVFRHT